MKKIFIIMIVLFFVAGCDDDTINYDNTVNDESVAYCDDPAFLDEEPSSFDGYVIYLMPETDFTSELSMLQQIYDIDIISYSVQAGRITADMSEDTMEQIRCEETVESIEYNAIGHLASP